MSPKFKDYCIGLLICGVAYGLYRLAAVPLLEPIEAMQVAYEVTIPEAPSDPSLAQFFPEDAWQRRAPRQLASEAGTLVFETLTQLDRKTWRLSPVTLIVRGQAGRPLLIESSEAKIEFAGSLDAIGMLKSPITAGQLLGAVKIHSPPSAPGADDAVHAEASNVWLNHREIKTTETVRLRLGAAEAVGRDLTIHLSGSEGKNPSSAVDRMELIYLDHLTFPLKQGGLWEPLNPAMPRPLPATEPNERPGGLVRVDCKGRLTFSFATMTLELLGRRVNVSHEIPGYPVDAIQCERLSMRLYDPQSSPAERPKWAQFIRKMEAYGSPVRIDAPTLASKAQADKLTLDFERGAREAEIELSGKTPIQIEHRGISITVPRSLAYRFSHDTPQRIGTFTTTGGGVLKVAESAGRMLRELRWRGDMQMLADEKNPDQRVLWVVGGFEADVASGGQIRGDNLFFEFTQLAREVSDEAATNGAEDADASGFKIIPKHLGMKTAPRDQSGGTASKVIIDLPQAYLEQERINLWFKQVPKTEKGTGEPLLALNRATGGPARQFVPEPPGQPPGQKVPAEAPPVSRPRIVSESLDAELSMADQEIVAYDFSARKEVQLEHMLGDANGVQRVGIQGDDLRVIENATTSLFQVNGHPARIEYADGYAEGPSIRLNAAEDVLEIERGGSIRIPTPLISSPVKLDGHGGTGSSFQWTLPPQLHFEGRLVLDRRVMETTLVRINGSGRSGGTENIWQFATQGEMLRMTLSDSLRLRQRRTPGTPSPQVQQISLIGGVAVDASNWLGEIRQSRHRLETPQLDFEPASGIVYGAPGNYRMWSLRQQNPESGSSSFFGNAPLLATHLVYHQRLQGNLQSRRLDFIRAVQVGMGPTTSWDQSIDVSRMEVPTEGQALLGCDQLSLYQPPGVASASTVGGQAPWEVEGLGGVSFRGASDKGLFSATCNRFNYTSQKDLLMLEGQPAAPAVFKRQLIGATKEDTVYAHSLSVRPRDMEIIEFQLQGANLGNLPAGIGVPPAAQADPSARRRNF